MDKFAQRQYNAKKLAHERYFSIFFFSLIFLAQIILFVSSFKYERLIYGVILCIIFDFGYGLEYFYHELFIGQMRNALSDMESKINIGHCVYSHLPISPSAESSYLWDSIRARVLYRYRYHRKYFDVNFLPSRTDDPAECAWAAAWFYANDDLKNFQNELLTPNHTEISSSHLVLLRFTLALGKYGYLHDFIDISRKDWLYDHHLRYSGIPGLSDIFDNSGIDV